MPSQPPEDEITFFREMTVMVRWRIRHRLVSCSTVCSLLLSVLVDAEQPIIENIKHRSLNCMFYSLINQT